MQNNKNNPYIKIVKNGPYLVSGNVPLTEKIILSHGRAYKYKEGRSLPQSETYSLCRCGKSTNAPFCDNTHERIGFIGTETASNSKYNDRADLIEGPGVNLLDDDRCAFARFCHREKGSAWELTENSYNEDLTSEAIKAASACPSGRLVALDKNGQKIEPIYEPAIEIIQDPERGASGGIFVKGNIPLESCEGFMYEKQNRYALCRCGRSSNKPFCDATHIPLGFNDKSNK